MYRCIAKLVFVACAPIHALESVSAGRYNPTELCPILHEPLGDNNVSQTPCGHNFRTSSIQQWFQNRTTCPSCRRAVTARNLRRARPLRSTAGAPSVQDALETKEGAAEQPQERPVFWPLSENHKAKLARARNTIANPRMREHANQLYEQYLRNEGPRGGNLRVEIVQSNHIDEELAFLIGKRGTALLVETTTGTDYKENYYTVWFDFPLRPEVTPGFYRKFSYNNLRAVPGSD